MDLDNRQAELRARTSFEAIDLGFAMTRRWAWPAWRGWLVGVVPMLAALWLSSFVLPVWLVALVAWWLKPLYERVPLLVLSRSLFGAVPSGGQVIRAMPGLLWHRLFTALTLYRLDPARTFLTPVSLLERLDGRARGRRRSVLSRGQWGAALWLTLTCWLMEMTVLVGLVGMVMLLLPEGPQWNWRTLVELEGTWQVLLGLWMLAMTLVEPFYAGGGFGLYINRRTRLEGWDVELVFRSLAQRLTLAAAVLLGLGLLPRVALADTGLEQSEGADAQQSSDEGAHVPEEFSLEDLGLDEVYDTGIELADPPEVEFELDRGTSVRVDRVAEEVLQDDLFGHTGEEPRWVLQEAWAQRLEEVWPDSCVEEEPTQMQNTALSPIIASIIEVLFWGFGAAAVVALGWVLLRSRFARDLSVDIELPDPVMGRSEQAPGKGKLPPSLADKARQLLASGDVEGALGLLYKGSVLHLVHVRGLSIEEGATEGDVLRTVRKQAKALSGYFRQLTNAWLEVAYAHRTVDSSRVSALIDEWPKHFAGGA